MTDPRTFEEKMADPDWRARSNEALRHVETLMRMSGPGQVLARRQYLETLEAKDPAMRAQVAATFQYRWETRQQELKGVA